LFTIIPCPQGLRIKKIKAMRRINRLAIEMPKIFKNLSRYFFMISVKRLIQIQVEISFIKDQEVSHIVKKR
jgi:hypothetical protein